MATAPPGSMSLDPQPTELVWEKENMSKTFNLYIYDYCSKRGFRKTARELLTEADLTPDRPPIDAKEGFLFEWWCVFWILFNTKSQGSNNQDAVIYTQHQHQHRMHQASLGHATRPLGHQMPQVNRMMNGNPGQMPFAMGPQPNGIPMQSTGSTLAGPNPAPPQNFPTLLPGQRPQQRGPNGVNPYQSPTIAHSSQNPSGNPNPQNSMNQLGPSPHMTHMARAGMLPPNVGMGSVSSTQTPPFSQLAANSPSRPATPGQALQPSPSLMDRKPPVNPHEATIAELNRFPPHILANSKQELGILDKDVNTLTLEEKTRLLGHARQRAGNPAVRKPGPPGPAGPSNLTSGMQLAGQRPGQPQPPQQQALGHPQQGSQPPPQQRIVKRNSTSPGEEHEQLPNSENSPPDRKRVRRSSISMDQAPPVGFPHQPQQQATQQLMNGSMMRTGTGPMPGGPMHTFPQHGPPGMGNQGMGLPMGAPGNAMSPGMGGPRAPSMIGYHQGMHAMTKGLATANLPGGGGGTPAPGDSPFNPGLGQPPFSGPQNNRLAQNKSMNMMPPPSPAGGPSKEQSKDIKPPGQNGAEGSPRNQQPSNPTPGAQGPPNPSGGAQVSTAPPTPSATSSSITAQSPSAINGTPTINPATQPPPAVPEVPPSFLSNEFMQSMANTLDDFDPQALFRTEDTGVNFEDFREWFNPDDLEMK